MSVIVHLVRHGEVENPQRLRYGRLAGFVLSANGRAQAACAGEYLARRGPRIATVYSSPLERAHETAVIVARALNADDVRIDDRLIEAESRFDGLTRAFAWRPYLARHLRSLFSSRRIETPFEVTARIRAAVVELAREAQQRDARAIVVVSHEAPIRYARYAFEAGASWRIRFGAVPRIGCRYASVTSVSFEGESVTGVEYAEP